MLQRAVSIFAVLVVSAMAAAADAPPDRMPRSFGEPALPVRGWIENFSYGTPGFSPDGKHLLIGNSRKGCIYDLATMKPICPPFPADWNADAYCYTAGGSLIFATGDIGPTPLHQRAQYFDALTGKPASPDFTCDGEYGESFTSSDGNFVGQQYRKGREDIIRVIDRRTSRIVWSRASDEDEPIIGLNADGSVLKFVDFGNLDGPEPASHLVRVRDGKILLADELESDDKPHCQFSPDGKSVLVIGGPARLRIFDLATEKMIAKFPADEAAKYSPDGLDYPEFSTDGKDVLFGRRRGQKRWSIAGGVVSPLAAGQAENHVEEMRSQDGRRAFCVYGPEPYNGGISGHDVVEVATGKPLWKLPADNEQTAPHLAMSGDGRHVAISFGDRNQVFVVDLNDLGGPPIPARIAPPPLPTRIGQPPLPILGRIDAAVGYNTVRVSPDGKSVTVCDRHKSAIWDASLLKCTPVAFPAGWRGLTASAGSFVGPGFILGIGCNYGQKPQTMKAQCFDAVTGLPVAGEFQAQGHGSVVCSDDGRYLAATYGEDGNFGFPTTTELRVIERATAKVVFARTFHGNLAFMEHISRDGRFVIYDEFDGKAVMRVIRVADGKFLFENEFKPRTVAFRDAVAFSPDGATVVIGEEHGFKVFDLASEKLVYESPDFNPSDNQWTALPLREASFSDDGSTLIYRQENDIRRWSVAEKRFLPSFQWKGNLAHPSLSRDARRLACQYRTNDVAPEDGTAIFDLDSGRMLWKWPRAWNWGNAVISPDGKRALVSDSIHGSIYAIDMDDQPPTSAPAAK